MNKKGFMPLTILTIILMLVIFFMLAPGINEMLDGVIGFAPNAVDAFILRMLVPGALLYVVLFSFNQGRSGQ